jgi:hypothetical protein
VTGTADSVLDGKAEAEVDVEAIEAESAVGSEVDCVRDADPAVFTLVVDEPVADTDVAAAAEIVGAEIAVNDSTQVLVFVSRIYVSGVTGEPAP